MLSRRSMLVWIVVGLSAFGFLISNLKAKSEFLNSIALVHEQQQVLLSASARRASVRGNNNNEEEVMDMQMLEQKIEQLQQQVDAASVREEFLEMQRQQFELERNALDQKVQELQSGPSSRNRNKSDREFPYPLTCPGMNLKSPSSEQRNYTITLAYHVGMIKNYKSIVMDQMETLDQCGLGQTASEFILSYSGGELPVLQNLIRPYNLFVNNDKNDEKSTNSSTNSRPTRIVHSTKAPWEGAIMNEIGDYCRARTVENVKSDQPTIVFYFHNKGASKWSHDWQQNINKPWTYSRSLYWRKYMEYFLLERPELCIDQIFHKGAGSCGILWHANHYSGNFWAANCDYLRLIQPIDMNGEKKHNYVTAEMWIGDKRGPQDGRRPHSLHENPSDTGLYRHLIEPFEYSDYNARWGKPLLQGAPATGTATKV